MKEIVFTTKSYSNEFVLNNSALHYPLEKPMICPICGAYEDGKNVDRRVFSSQSGFKVGVIQYECTHCKANYLVIYEVDSEAKRVNFGSFYPHIAVKEYKNEVLKDVSPKFLEVYNQALRSEAAGDIELAAIGCRTALEYLVKDYAASVLGKDRSEVAKKKLFDAISAYLGSTNLINSADVVRILGNDYTHYERKYPQHDYQLLKKYMEIFISLIEAQVMASNPPIKRAGQ